MIYNMLQIFILEQQELLRNVVTRFSRFHFSRVFWPFRNIFPAHRSMHIADFFLFEREKIFL